MNSALSLVAILLLLVQPGLAQTQLVASNPPAGGVIRLNSITFWLRFNKRIENAQCSLTLQTPAENRSLALQAQIASDQVQAFATNLGKGSYSLNWQVETPGKPATSGAVAFSVR
ncbi:MAG: copper resistance protein CopC [Acidobacteriaceae bacterium]